MPSHGSRTRQQHGGVTQGQLANGNTRHGKMKARSGQEVRRTMVITEEMMEAERAGLLEQKQSQLESVVDRHDTLVREIFHMEHFVMMLGYDPKEAKQDHTNVFENYKAMYNLVDKTMPGPSRPTRSRRSEQMQLLKTPFISAPIPTTPSKGKVRVKTAEARTPGKNGKAAAISLDQGKPDMIVPDIARTPEKSISVVARKNGDMAKVVNLSSTPKKYRERKGSVSMNGHLSESSPVGSRRSDRLKEGIVSSDLHQLGMNITHGPSLVSTPTIPRRRPREEYESPCVSPAPAKPKFNIKRIRLLVRRPPPNLTNPRQRAPPSKYNSSLNTFLNSYLTFNNEDIEEKALLKSAAIDAATFERAKVLQKQGRFIPDVYLLSSPGINDGPSYSLPRVITKYHWDNVIEAVINYQKSMGKSSTGQQIAGQIAVKIRTYWEGQEVKKEKLRQQEERRLRALAKATIRSVTNEWRKAVFHIREQERRRLEAEEVRRGHEHLDAILDQSGQLLETQQGDLSRGDITRSRSSSVSRTLRDWESEGDENDEDIREGDGGEQDGEEQEDVEDGVEEEPPELTETKVNEGDTTNPDDGDSDSDVDVLSDEDNENDIRLLLDSHDPSFTHTSVRPSNGDGHDFVASMPGEASLDDSRYDEDNDLNGSPAPVLDEYPKSDRSSQPPALSSDTVEHDQIGTENESLQPPIVQLSPPRRILPSPMFSPDGDLEHLPLHEDLRSSPTPSIGSELMTLDADLSPPLTSSVGSSHQVHMSSVTRIHSFVHGSPEPDDALEASPELDHTENNGQEDNNHAQTVVHLSQNHIHEPAESEVQLDPPIPEYLTPFAVAPVDWDPNAKVVPPLLLRGVLRPYQQSGLEWLASLHANNLNGILADEMGLGKTIQTIALLAHLACDRGIWGPHLIVVPTSVLLNWEMEFKKFLPGFKILSYHGSTKRRKELRQGWNDRHHFNPWYYMILDEAHMIKNFKSQRWNLLLMFRSFRRLLLTGTPLQNNLTELWALLQFLMSGTNFANLKEFGDWFSNPLEKAIEMGNVLDDETMQRVSKLHTVLRPYLLRRLKRDVEKELPSKFEHLVICPLSKRQRFLYDEFMSRAQTRDALQSGVYQKIANILMQLRKVCNHPDLFEVRPIVTSLAMTRSAAADFEIKDLLVRRRLINNDEEVLNLDMLGFRFIDRQNKSLIAALESRSLDATSLLPFISEIPGEPPMKDTRTIAGFRTYSAYMQRANTIARWSHIGYLNRLRCNTVPIYGSELLSLATRFYRPIFPVSALERRHPTWEGTHLVNSMVKSYEMLAEDMASSVGRFAFVTPPVVALDMPRIALIGCEAPLINQPLNFDEVLHMASVKLQIAFPDPSLLQYDCGKLQELTHLMREKKAGGHRVLIFTQMTRILDILETFLNFHGYLYLRLDGATKIEDRQYITERFNADSRIFCFIASSRSGGVGINLTGADTVIFYDSDFNPQMDRQCEDRAHRIGQIRDVHIYRFVSQHTVEEALLRKANQKRSLDDLVIQRGEFDWRSLFHDQGALSKALEEFADTEDAHAAVVAAREEIVMEGADEADFGGDIVETQEPVADQENLNPIPDAGDKGLESDSDGEEAGSIVDYMILFVQRDYEYFREWRI